MDDRLRKTLLAYRRLPDDLVSKESAIRALLMAGYDREGYRSRVEARLRYVFIDQLDYREFGLSEACVENRYYYGRLVGTDRFIAQSRADLCLIDAYYPSIDEILAGTSAEDIRFVVNASLKERALVLETMLEEFPEGLVVSSQKADGKRPTREMIKRKNECDDDE